MARVRTACGSGRFSSASTWPDDWSTTRYRRRFWLAPRS